LLFIPLVTLPLACAPILSYGEDWVLENEMIHTQKKRGGGGRLWEIGERVHSSCLPGYVVGELHISVVKQCIFTVGIPVKKGIEAGRS